MLNPTDQYNLMLREAHRRPAQPVGPPALIRHIALWPNPVDESAPDIDSEGATAYRNRYNWRRWNWYYQIDQFIATFIDRLNASPQVDSFLSTPFSSTTHRVMDPEQYKLFKRSFDEHLRHPSKAPLPSPDSPANVAFTFRWRAYIVKFQLILHNEYATLSFAIDLSKAPSPLPADVAASADSISDALCNIKNALDTISISPNEADAIEALTLVPTARFLYDDIWTEFDRRFLPANSVFLNDGTAATDEMLALELNLGSEVFADFRGIVLMCGDEAKIHGIKTKHEPRMGLEDVRSFSRTEQFAALRRAWRFVAAAAGGTEKAKDLEYTACTMLDRRAIYISSLGSQSLYGTRGGALTETPPGIDRVRYLILMNGLDGPDGCFDRWQIGRLVQRINTLGTLRLVALRDLKALRRANPTIMHLGRYLDDLYHQELGGRRKVHEKLQQLFSELSRVGENVPYGIAYRINRSRYAIESFKIILTDLRIRRIPGWQPYDEFVRRRLYSVYNSIDMLGHRMEAIRRRGNTLLDIQHTRKLVEYQKLADIIVLLGGTYYLGNILDHGLLPTLKYIGGPVAPGKIYTTGSFVLAFAIVAIWRFIAIRRRE